MNLLRIKSQSSSGKNESGIGNAGYVVFQSLRPALLNVREMCYRISDMGLCRIEKGYTYQLQQFRDAQFKQLSEVEVRLAEFRELVKEVVRSSCR